MIKTFNQFGVIVTVDKDRGEVTIVETKDTYCKEVHRVGDNIYNDLLDTDLSIVNAIELWDDVREFYRLNNIGINNE